MRKRAFNAHGHHKLRSVEIIRFTSIETILAKHQVTAEQVSDVISRTFSYRWLVDIVSSQLDADRMDYILRDSLMTGVKYGNYDSEWLLHCLAIGAEPQQRDATPNSWKLCLEAQRGASSEHAFKR